jgi:hypothetical protein
MHALAAVHISLPMRPVTQQTWPEAHAFMPHMGPWVPASPPLLPLPLVLPPLLEPLPLPLAVPLLLVVPPLLLAPPLLPLLMPPLLLAPPLLPVLMFPLLEPPIPLLVPLPPPPSSPGALDEPPHATGVAIAAPTDVTKTNAIVFMGNLLGPRDPP